MPFNTSAPAAKQSTQTHSSSITYLSSDKIKKVVALFAQHVASDIKAAGYSPRVEMPAVTQKLLTSSRSSVVEICKNIAGPDGLRVFCGRGGGVHSSSGNRIMRGVVHQMNREFGIKTMRPKGNKSVCISALTESLSSLGVTFHQKVSTPLEPCLSKKKVVKKILQLLRDIPHEKNETVGNTAAKTMGPLPALRDHSAQLAEYFALHVPGLYELDDSDISLFSFDFDDQSLMKKVARQN